MADKTGIEWTEATWNPVVGCSLATAGCTNCYAMKMAARIEMMNPGSHYGGTTKSVKGKAVWTGKLALAPEHILLQPLRWRRARTIFVNSMSDLFHEDVPDAWIDRVFTVMALCPQHTFQVLTKRSARMRAYLSQFRVEGRYVVSDRVTSFDRRDGNHFLLLGEEQAWPLPNVWLGVSTEDQRRVNGRVPDLLATPAAIRFVSAEPLLGSIDYTRLEVEIRGQVNALTGVWATLPLGDIGGRPVVWANPPRTKLDWIIVGGESGPGARPMHPAWARSIRDQCHTAGTAFMFKQWGAWAPWKPVPGGDLGGDVRRDRVRWVPLKGELTGRTEPGGLYMRNVGKKAAGRRLDGVEHNGMPAIGMAVAA